MTDATPPDDRDRPRLLTDGGTDQPDITRTVTPTGVVTRDVDGKDVEMLRVPISSTRMDREGDRFTREALDGMADQIREEQPLMFQNHGLAGNWMDAIPYDQAETIGGHMDAEVEETEDGEYELYSYVNPDGTHPEGERMLKQVRDEYQPIKFSVGFKILNSDPIEDDAGNEIGREFTDVDLMEDSKVGIPANRDASVTHEVAAKGQADTGLPGFQMHPLVRMMAGASAFGGDFGAKAMADGGQNPEADEVRVGDHVVSREGDIYVCQDCLKGATNRSSFEGVGCPDEPTYTRDGKDATELRSELDAARDELAELRATVEELREDDGDECSVDTDCPEGEVCLEGECVPEDDVDDEDSVDPEELEALQAELKEAREALESGRASPDTKDTDTTEDPDLTRNANPDATDDVEPDDESSADPSDWLDHDD